MIEWDPFELRASRFKDGQVVLSDETDPVSENWPGNPSAKEYLGFTLSKKRVFGIFLILTLAFSTILYRAYALQIKEGEYYRNIAEGNRIRLLSVKAARGLIYDKQGRTLAQNVPFFNLTITPADLPPEGEERSRLFREVAGIIQETDLASFELNLNEKIRQAKNKFTAITVAENLNYEQSLMLKTRSQDWPGVSIVVERIRKYKISDDGKNYLGHILGYVGPVTEQDVSSNETYQLTDKLGKAGLELSYEKIIKGSDGRERIEVDALGKTKKLIAREPATPGVDAHLSIDLEVQERLSQILARQLEKQKKYRGAAVVLNPQNGDILAMVSLPGFDNNLFASGISVANYQALITDPNLPLFNRNVSGEYPSGSIFKPVVAAAALEEGVITRNTVVSSVGGIRVNQWFFPDWKAGGHGYTNVTKAIAESVNTFFYMVGGGTDNFKGLGISKLLRYAKSFGFGERLGVDLPGEKTGFLPTPEWKENVKNERWYIGDTYHLAIGQGDLLVTPLQLAAMTAVFANGGTLYQPRLVSSLGHGTSELTPVEPKVLNKDIVSNANMAVVRQGMRETILYGSGRALGGLGFTLAGKTGTAQWHTEKLPHAWFTGFAPYNNPEVVITVLIEEGGEGSAISVPVAGEFLNWYFNTYKKAPTKLTSVDKGID